MTNQDPVINAKNLTSKIIGHRGAAGLRPENTLSAIDYAVGLVIGGVEVDVHLTKDNQVVVYHDYDLKPEITRRDGAWLTESGALIKDLTYAELSQYDVGGIQPGTEWAARHPDQQRVDGEKIPLLSDVIERLKKPDAVGMELLVELKYDLLYGERSPDKVLITDAIIDVLRAGDFIERSVLISFDWEALSVAADREPTLRRAYLTYPMGEILELALEKHEFLAQPNLAGLDRIASLGGTFWGPFHKDLSRELVSAAHDRELQISTWAPQEKGDLARMIDLGVDYVTTDYPSRIKELQAQ